MGIEKAEIKILTAQDLTAQLGADLKNADTLIAEAKGGEKAMKEVIVALASVMAGAKQDLDDENASVDDVKLLRRYISRMQQSVTDVAKKQEGSRLVAEGISRGIGQARLRIQAMEKSERNKLESKDSEPDDPKKPKGRKPGKRPETPEHKTRSKAPEEAPTKKKRGRPRKAKSDAKNT